MTIPISSTIERRLLVNFRVDPDMVVRLLPEPLRPNLVDGWAVVGICFLKLRHVRPAGVPWFGLSSENVAHRIGVEWPRDDTFTPGVYVPHRETSSRLAALAGGKLLEGELSFARFHVNDSDGQLSIRVTGRFESRTEIAARPTESFESELFSSLSEASRFFCEAPVAFSPNRRRDLVEGVALRSPTWTATPMKVEHLRSSVIEDATVFPAGSWSFDSAMIIRNVRADWNSAGVLAPAANGVDAGAGRAR